MVVGKQRYALITVLSALLALPSAFAAMMGMDFINTNLTGTVQSLFKLIGSIFNIQLGDQMYLGFVKFLFFVLFFAIYNYSLRNYVFKDVQGGPQGLGRKTSTVVAFSLAAISAWFIPNNFILDVGSWISAMVVLLVTVLAPTIAALVIAFGKKGDGDAGQKKSRVDHVVGLLIIFVALGLVVGILYLGGTLPPGTLTGTPSVSGNHAGGTSFGFLFDLIGNVCVTILGIAMLVKLIQVIFGIGGGAAEQTATGGSRGLLDRFNDFRNDGDRRADDANKREMNRRRREDELRRRYPGQVSNVDFFANPAPGVTLRWAANGEDNIERYEFEYTTDAAEQQDTPEGGRKDRRYRPANPPHVTHPTTEQVLNGLLPPGPYRFRVRAVNKLDNRGPWGYSRWGNAGAPGPAPANILPQINLVEQALNGAQLPLTTAIAAYQTLNVILQPNPLAIGAGRIVPTGVVVTVPQAQNARIAFAAAVNALSIVNTQINNITTAGIVGVAPGQMQNLVALQTQYANDLATLNALAQVDNNAVR